MMSTWNVDRCPDSQKHWLNAAVTHNLDQLIYHFHPQTFIELPMNAAHVFACGITRRGGMHASRQALQWLLDQGQANLSAVDIHGWLPINYAVWFGRAATTDVLLELGSPVHNSSGAQPLDTALESVAQLKCISSETCAHLLLMHGADPNQGRSLDPCFGGVTWMVWALLQERFEWAERLLASGIHSLKDKEKMLLSLRASGPALAWAQTHGFDMLSVVSSRHEHFDIVCEAQAHCQKKMILNQLSSTGLVPQSPHCHQNIDQNSEDDSSGSGKSGGRSHRRM